MDAELVVLLDLVGDAVIRNGNDGGGSGRVARMEILVDVGVDGSDSDAVDSDGLVVEGGNHIVVLNLESEVANCDRDELGERASRYGKGVATVEVVGDVEDHGASVVFVAQQRGGDFGGRVAAQDHRGDARVPLHGQGSRHRDAKVFGGVDQAVANLVGDGDECRRGRRIPYRKGLIGRGGQNDAANGLGVAIAVRIGAPLVERHHERIRGGDAGEVFESEPVERDVLARGEIGVDGDLGRLVVIQVAPDRRALDLRGS